MGSSSNHAAGPLPGIKVVRRFQVALAILLEAYDYAQKLRRPVWDFAVQNRILLTEGLTTSDLRWLVCREFVEHAAEQTRTGQNHRVFHRTGTLTFTKRTCFVLTATGAAFARQLAETVSLGVPQWDKDQRELRIGAVVVKQFKVPAPNQETILAVFQEEGWPPRIDDPLPPHPDQVAKKRLHDTITTLNRHHQHRLIRFLGDGTGQGVRWRFLLPQQDQEVFS